MGAVSRVLGLRGLPGVIVKIWLVVHLAVLALAIGVMPFGGYYAAILALAVLIPINLPAALLAGAWCGGECGLHPLLILETVGLGFVQVVLLGYTFALIGRAWSHFGAADQARRELMSQRARRVAAAPGVTSPPA